MATNQNKFIKALRWPAKRTNSLNPWYTIVWRAIWWVPMRVSLFITCFFLALCVGPTHAMIAWKDF